MLDIVQAALILSPRSSDVLENSTLELTCQGMEYKTSATKWRTLDQHENFSVLKFYKKGVCSASGFLADRQYFETRCYSNGTINVKIKRVNISNDGQGWTCSQGFTKSNIAYITVQGKNFNVYIRIILK